MGGGGGVENTWNNQIIKEVTFEGYNLLQYFTSFIQFFSFFFFVCVFCFEKSPAFLSSETA